MFFERHGNLCEQIAFWYRSVIKLRECPDPLCVSLSNIVAVVFFCNLLRWKSKQAYWHNCNVIICNQLYYECMQELWYLHYSALSE